MAFLLLALILGICFAGHIMVSGKYRSKSKVAFCESELSRLACFVHSIFHGGNNCILMSFNKSSFPHIWDPHLVRENVIPGRKNTISKQDWNFPCFSRRNSTLFLLLEIIVYNQITSYFGPAEHKCLRQMSPACLSIFFLLLFLP